MTRLYRVKFINNAEKVSEAIYPESYLEDIEEIKSAIFVGVLDDDFKLIEKDDDEDDEDDDDPEDPDEEGFDEDDYEPEEVPPVVPLQAVNQ